MPAYVEDTLSLTDLESQNNPNRWSPQRFRAHQLLDYLEIHTSPRSESDGPPATTVLKLLANRDVHIYGEFVMHDGAIRSFNTVGITCLEEGQDILSLRSGVGAATEVARFTKDSQLNLVTPFGKNYEPAIVLDARQANTGTGENWRMSSDPVSGSLRFTRDSGIANPYAELRPSGDLSLSDGFFLIQSGTSVAPTSGDTGALYLWDNSGAGKWWLKVYNGSYWVKVELT